VGTGQCFIPYFVQSLYRTPRQEARQDEERAVSPDRRASVSLELGFRAARRILLVSQRLQHNQQRGSVRCKAICFTHRWQGTKYKARTVGVGKISEQLA
jgi:hypothetical protein